MAARHRTSLRAAALGLVLMAVAAVGAVGSFSAPAGADVASGVQIATTTVPAQAAPTSVADGGVGTTTSTSASSDQTILAAPPPSSTRLATESRKVMAIIGALVAVALGLAILTIRYWRSTRPLLVADSAPIVPADADPIDASGPVGDAAVGAPSESGEASTDGEDAVPVMSVDPVPTDEVERVEIPPKLVRPSTAARRAALGVGG